MLSAFLNTSVALDSVPSSYRAPAAASALSDKGPHFPFSISNTRNLAYIDQSLGILQQFFTASLQLLDSAVHLFDLLFLDQIVLICGKQYSDMPSNFRLVLLQLRLE